MDKVNKDCKECGGSGYIHRDGKRIKCICVLKNRFRDYLGSTYLGVPYNDTINFTAEEKFRRFDEISKDRFKSFVKSYLIVNAMKLSHNLVTPYTVIESYFEDKINTRYKDLYSVDFLSVYFTDDLPNKLYGDIFYSIFESRLLNNKETWVHSWVKFDDNIFISKFTKKLSEYILKNFSCAPKKKLENFKFKKGLKV